MKERNQFELLLFVFKFLNGYALPYLASCFTRYNQTHNGLSYAMDNTRLSVPKFPSTPICCRWKFLSSRPGSTGQFTNFNLHSKLGVIIQNVFLKLTYFLSSCDFHNVFVIKLGQTFQSVHGDLFVRPMVMGSKVIKGQILNILKWQN